MLDSSTVEAVKNYHDIVPVIGDYVSLKKRGRNYLGLCPFHSEKTPSFNVSPEKHFWHCFGCHESGDLIAFIMKIDNLDFTEAVKYIAEKVGIEVKEIEKKQGDSNKKEERDKMLDLIFLAREYFKECLNKNDEIYKYLIERGLNKDTISEFHLGYAPSSKELLNYLNQKNFPDDLMIKSGLFYQNDAGMLISRFRERVIFPVIDHVGKTIAFGGRTLSHDKNIAKYINSPETLFFNKSRILYGLDKAKSVLKKADSVIIMEGYMDVLMAHQYGFSNTIASMGTALTPMQAQLLKRYTDKVFLAMDSDEAGQASIEKSYEVLKQFDTQIKVLSYTEKDPAETLIKNGPEYFQKIIDNAINMVDFKFARLCNKTDISQIENASKIISEIAPLLKAEPDKIIQNHYIAKISQKLKIDKELIMAQIQKNRYTISRKKLVPLYSKKNKYHKAAEYLISQAAADIEIRQKVIENLEEDDFFESSYQGIFNLFCRSKLKNNALLVELNNEEQKKILAEILIDERPITDENKTEWQDCVTTLKSRKAEQRVEEIKNKLVDLNSLNEEEQNKLLEEINQKFKIKNEEGL